MSDRFAVVDVGSNSVKLLVAERGSDGSFNPIFETSSTTRLGEGIHSRRLREGAIRRTLEALEEFAAQCRELEVAAIAAVGTSALRDAVNQEELIDRAHAVGIPLHAISGEEEARLSFLAVREDPLWRNAGPLLVVDIGGGSTEIIEGAASGVGIARRVSLPLGAVRLTEAALYSDPPTIQQIDDANERARAALAALTTVPGAYTAVGVGGTFTNMARVHRGIAMDFESVHGSWLSLSAVESQVELYASRSVRMREEIVGLDPSRADIILGGAVVLCHVLQRAGLEGVFVSSRGLRWGAMYDRFGLGAPAARPGVE